METLRLPASMLLRAALQHGRHSAEESCEGRLRGSPPSIRERADHRSTLLFAQPDHATHFLSLHLLLRTPAQGRVCIAVAQDPSSPALIHLSSPLLLHVCPRCLKYGFSFPSTSFSLLLYSHTEDHCCLFNCNSSSSDSSSIFYSVITHNTKYKH